LDAKTVDAAVVATTGVGWAEAGRRRRAASRGMEMAASGGMEMAAAISISAVGQNAVA